MDYSQLSDFEINKLIGIALGKELMPDDFQDFGLAGFSEVMLRNGDFKDYCSDPADAWPIIESNKISLTYHPSRDEWSAVFNSENIAMHGSPLRAAMIVFLMMQDANHA
ncbi:DUF2591 family protein [Escherichia coli]|uniref:phage protein NinX family protein n=1 Tax=Escherichia coli TaxID=562 RepID=UPI00193432F2|nr:phage protein NinX family protein [Escherichia coli]MBL7390669.1 DUF2591 family protein [Escherichia coli]UWH33037.1 DUF2591 family protein [Escherichia coli]UWH37701.1 DUF2591 family protein [Escherichia coli]